jgi:hypothetical protein
MCSRRPRREVGGPRGEPAPPAQKTDEWERYCSQVTDWDVEEYLDVLP